MIAPLPAGDLLALARDPNRILHEDVQGDGPPLPEPPGDDEDPLEPLVFADRQAELRGRARAALFPVEPEPASASGVRLERVGPSTRVLVDPPGLRLMFRDVRTDGELAADVSVDLAGRHLFRTTTTLSITTRERLARTAVTLAGCPGQTDAIRDAVFAAVEAVLSSEETLSDGVDLRRAPLVGAGPLYVARPLWENAPTNIVGPGDGGKSTLSHAIAVSVAGGLPVIPGVVPVVMGPVLYVAGEDAVAHWHTRSVEAICRGIGVERRSLAHPITLFDTAGRPIHRIARAIAERAADYAGVILDPLSALLAAGDQVRDRDSLFWRAVDTIGRPTLILAHPNRAESRRWTEADGRVAGSEINRDRVRLSWALQWRDEKAVAGTSFRRYTLMNTKRNHGPALDPIGFAVAWQFGIGDDDPGVCSFVASEPFRSSAPLSDELAAALEAYHDGATTPAPLAKALGIGVNTAKSRLRLLKGRGEISDAVVES